MAQAKAHQRNPGKQLWPKLLFEAPCWSDFTQNDLSGNEVWYYTKSQLKSGSQPKNCERESTPKTNWHGHHPFCWLIWKGKLFYKWSCLWCISNVWVIGGGFKRWFPPNPCLGRRSIWGGSFLQLGGSTHVGYIKTLRCVLVVQRVFNDGMWPFGRVCS